VRVRLLAACGVVVAGLVIVGVSAVAKSHSDGPQLPPPPTVSPQMVAYLHQAQPLPRATGYPNSMEETNLGPLVQSLNQSWSAYFGGMPGKPVVAVKGWGSAGVGLLNKDDAVYPMCGREVKFDPAASAIIYCQEPFLAKGQNLRSANILVPFQPFMAELQKVGSDYKQAQLNTSLVAAFFYASHVQNGLASQHLAAWQDGTAAQMCLAGVGVATLVPQEPTARQWQAALGFLHRFWHYPQLSSQASDLRKGYQTADPKSCLIVA